MFLAAVIQASLEIWQYYDVIRQYANQTCVGHLENLAVTIDAMLEDTETNNAIKTLFGLEALSDYYFVYTIEVSGQLGCRQTRSIYPLARNHSISGKRGPGKGTQRLTNSAGI